MSEKMLAAVYHAPHDLRVEQVPRPQIGPDEILLKVLSPTICGIDMRILKGGHRKYAPCSIDDCLRTAEIVNSGHLDLSPLVTKRFPLSESPAAFAAAADGRNLRVAIVP